MPILVRLVSEQEGGAPILTPSSLLRRLGQEINDENSILYWCYKVWRRYEREPNVLICNVFRTTFRYSVQR